MATVKKRKNTILSDTAVKSINFFGKPNIEKRNVFLRAQKMYADAMNNYCSLLTEDDTYYWQILNNKTHSTELRAFEKRNRIKELGSVLSQNAFDDVVNKLYNREQNIKSEVNSYIHNEFTKSITLYYCMVLNKTKPETIKMIDNFLNEAIQIYKKSSTNIKNIKYYRELKRMLYKTSLDDFNSIKEEIRFWYDSFSLEYKLPYFNKPFMRVDSRNCKLEISKDIATPFVFKISNPFVRGEKISIPLNTTSVVMRRYSMYNSANSFNIKILDNGTLRVIGSVTKGTHYKENDLFIGCDTGITDALYLSDGKNIGTFKDVIDYNINVVEPAEAQKSNLRNKLRKIKHYYRTHKNTLSAEIKTKLVKKMDNLHKMIQQNKVAKHCKNHYHAMLDKRIKDIIKKFLKHVKNRDVTVVLERLDIKEFNSSKRSNALRSVFARGKFQKRFLEQLAWNGIKFAEIDPTYTSRVCPICFNLDKKNRNNKNFQCTCCNFKGDADFVASINIKDRIINPELKKIEASNPYSRNKRKILFEKYFADKNAEYLRESLSA